MIFADRLSGYPLVNVWTKDLTTNQVVKQLQQYCSPFGKPLNFKSDGGAQFDSKEMREFLDELLADLQYRFKIDINADQTVDQVIEAMKTHLKGQRSIILARYNLFTRRQQYGETFEEWHCELRRL